VYLGVLAVLFLQYLLGSQFLVGVAVSGAIFWILLAQNPGD